MKKPHKHRDLIIAWANGEKIQYKVDYEWVDYEHPSWCNLAEYRIKPEVIRHRVALFEDKKEKWTLTTNDERHELIYSQNEYFKKWITDWIEAENGITNKRH